jgi:uncharacterized protein (TIGR00730 family)
MDNNTSGAISFAQMSELAVERVALISKEFSEGFQFLQNYPRSVTIFGSTKSKEGDPMYARACDLASRIVGELKYSITTGGGPGIMEAANRGAYEAGGNSVGLLIELPAGQPTNKYLTAKCSFHHFFVRKVCLAFAAEAYVFFPGGFGTLDEFSEILTLVQTAKIHKVPIILVDVEYWTPLINFFREKTLAEGMIDEEDLSLFVLTDDDDEIIKVIKKSPVTFSVPHVPHQKNELP